MRTVGGTRNRWGDYSGASIDPSDGSFWIFNEYAMSRGTSFGGEDGRWKTAWGNFAAAALPIQLSYLRAVAAQQNSVRVEWGTITETNNFGFYIQKQRNG